MSKYSEVPVRISSPMARSHICADCSTPEPTWASINRGVLICDECCSVHRSLGRHISQVKSLKKSSWCPSLLSMVQMVSSFANNVWEHTLRDPSSVQSKHKHRKPNPRDPTYPTKAEFIRAKYQFLSFMNKQKDNEVNSIDDISKQLHSSVRTASLETSLRLLSLGADPNYYHPDRGNCPLHIAAQSGHIHQVELLIVYGADPGAFDANDQTPVDYARKEGHTDCADRLVECQFELTDRLAFYLCSRRPDHKNQHHFIIPEMADNSVDLSELAKAARRRLQGIPNKLFEDLAMDVYDEVDRRENESIWINSQASSDVVSDKQTVPFLPVNPEFTSTRNQGRQKLARFNPREFATLIIDILSEVKRRQQGSATPQNATITKEIGSAADRIRKDPSQRSIHKTSSLSDEEPIYDSVASDEDYASIGDSQSLKEEKLDMKEICKEQSITLVSDHPESTITLDKYLAMKRLLMESQLQVKQLVQAQHELKQDVALLQNMVQKLMQENSILRSREGTLESSGSVSNGYESMPSSLPRSLPRGTRPQSMFEPRDPQKHKHWHMQAVTEESKKSESDQKISATSEQVNSSQENPGVQNATSDYDTAGSIVDESGCARSRLDSANQVTPTNSHTSLHGDGASGATPCDSGGSAEMEDNMPTQDEVVKKTERITKKIQELLVRAKDGKPDSFAMCADKIHTAVLDMASLFPMPLQNKAMRDLIQELTTWSAKLQEMCNQTLGDSSSETQGGNAFIHEVIQCAFIIAKAAKQLVIMFE